MSAQIDLPATAGGWLLDIDDKGITLAIEGWSGYVSGDANPPREGLFVGRGGFRIPMAEVPAFLVALDTAISLGFPRSEVHEAHVWKVTQVSEQVLVAGPLIENTETNRMARSEYVSLPWRGLCKLRTLLVALLSES